MEQSSDNEHKPVEIESATVAPAPQSKELIKPKNVVMGLLFLAIVGGALWFILSQEKFAHQAVPAIGGTQEGSLQGKENQQIEGAVEYSSAMNLVKTIPRPDDSATIRVYSIGKITEGPYKDKILELALYDYDSGGQVNTYMYFISDNKGNPVAWDKNFLHNSNDCIECDEVRMSGLLGLTDATKKNLDFLPKEFSLGINFQSSDKKQSFILAFYDALLLDNSLAMSHIAETEKGWPIARENKDDTSGSIFHEPSYYVVFPFGKMMQIALQLNFVDVNDVPSLTWSTGTTTIASYHHGEYAYGWEDCYDGISQSAVEAAFVETGKTAHGDPLYEADAVKYPKVYQCLHEKTKRYIYDDATQKGEYKDTVTYADFVLSHPMFFWKNPYGDYVAFLRSDIVPPAEKAKPVIYLYPKEKEKVSVRVFPLGGFSKTIPVYHTGWDVTANPDGALVDNHDGAPYPYLFWEGGKDGIVRTPKEGFVASRADVGATLKNALTQYGLNDREQKDFLDFWVPKLSHAPYYFITFISREEIDRTAPLEIHPTPDTVVRVLMDYKPLEKPYFVPPLQITPTPRTGFTVIEWGGIVRD